MSSYFYPALLLVALSPFVASAGEYTFSIKTQPVEVDRKNAMVCVPVMLPKDWAEPKSVTVEGSEHEGLTGQITAPSLLAKPAAAPAGKVARELWFQLPQAKAGASETLKVTLSDKASEAGKGFHWEKNNPLTEITLKYGDDPVLRYMCTPLDESTPAAREATFKVFHHVFAPDGETLLTKGPGGKFTHHRGLFFGFNKVTYGDNKQCDVWHCKAPAYQSHQAELSQEAGPVLSRHRVKIGWHGAAKEIFAFEEREVTVFFDPRGLLIDFASRVSTTGGPIKLDGDPQHAGFHFRASGEVADANSKETYYLRPDGKDAKGKTRNWPDVKTHVNLPWNAMSFVVADQRYTIAYLDRPENPKEARFSERDYGRFGSYFQYTIEDAKPLEVNYRTWLRQNELDGGEIEAESKNFTMPVKAVVVE